MAALAAHAVQPTCSRCGRPVRSSLEISSEVSELQQLVAAARGLCEADAPGAEAIYPWVAALAADELERLLAELGGDHLSCACPAASPEVGRLRSLIAAASSRVNDCQFHTSY